MCSTQNPRQLDFCDTGQAIKFNMPTKNAPQRPNSQTAQRMTLPLDGKQLSRIVFVAPRLHNNQIGWLTSLERAGYHVRYYLFCRDGSWDPSDSRFRILERAALSGLLLFFARRSRREREDVVLRTTFFPSVVASIRLFLQNRDAIFVFRDVTRATLILLFFARVLMEPHLVFYEQGFEDAAKRERMSKTRSLRSLTSISASQLLRLERVPFVNPVPLQPLSQTDTPDAIVPGQFFLPFVVPTKHEVKAISGDSACILRGAVIGKYQEYKNLFILEDALLQISPEYRSALSLTFVGAVQTTDDENYRSKLGEQLQDIGLARLQVLKNRSRDWILDYCSSVHFVVLPSFSDLVGIAPLEAMGAGALPIVSTRAGSSRYFENGRHGFTFDPKRPLELAQIIAHLASNPAVVEFMRFEAQNFARKYLSEQAFINRWMTVERHVHATASPRTRATVPPGPSRRRG